MKDYKIGSMIVKILITLYSLNATYEVFFNNDNGLFLIVFYIGCVLMALFFCVDLILLLYKEFSYSNLLVILLQYIYIIPLAWDSNMINSLNQKIVFVFLIISLICSILFYLKTRFDKRST